MREALTEILSSKKALAALIAGIATILVTVAGRLHLALDEGSAAELSTKLVGLAASYIVGQGVADHGKSAALIVAEKEAPKP